MKAGEPETYLPKDVLEHALQRDKEFLWRPSYIPTLIEEARKANLVNMGGQLQILCPTGQVMELYWIGADTYTDVPAGRSWDERVADSAAKSADAFRKLAETTDFVELARTAMYNTYPGLNDTHYDVENSVYCVWYVISAEYDAELRHSR